VRAMPMTLEVDGHAVFVSTGGKDHARGQRLVVLLHGAGADHSVWALQSRWLAWHGANVLAVDLPGHGRSDGPALTDIGALADWTARLIAAVGAEKAALAGHSMGALIALETASRWSERRRPCRFMPICSPRRKPIRRTPSPW
jgi:pimeloyl-ACP methyl ester carboxylesterase